MLRRWISIIAVVSVLLHTVALVRHATVMAAGGAAAVMTAGLEADLGVICHAANAAASAAGSEPSRTSGDPRQGSAPCPVCIGLCASVAIEAPLQPLLVVMLPADDCTVVADDQRVGVLKRLRPPSRGPPTQA